MFSRIFGYNLNVMKKVLLLLFLIAIGINFSSAQVTYVSEDNSVGDWENNSIWDKSQTWANDNPGTNLGGATDDVIVFGYVTRNGNLGVGGDIRLIVNDTLVISGNVNAAGGSSIIVNDGGVLIILGDLSTAGGLDFDNTGEGFVAVGGEFSAAGGATIETNDKFYIYDDNPQFNGGASVNGEDPRENPEGEFKSDDDLAIDNPTIKEFIDSGGSTSLPIELKSFSASKSGKNIALDWVTAKEENFSHFEIERSLDQENWEQIGLVQGLGESMSDVHYDFTDRNAPFGVIYYRLNAVDIDASFEYSPVVKVEVGFEGKLAVSPNPVKDASNLKIQVPSEFREDLGYVGLFDLSGAMVQEFRNFNTDGSLQINQKLKSGMYILKVNHNGLQENIRVVIQ